MTRLLNPAMAVALAAGAFAMPAAAPAKDKPAAAAAVKLSPKVQEQAAKAQAALAKNDYATAKAALDAAEPLIVSPDDKYVVGQFLVNTGQGLKDDATTMHGIDLMVDSSKTPPDVLAKLLQAQAGIAYNAKDYKKSQTAAERLAQLDPKNADNFLLLGELRHNTGDVPGSLAAFQQAVDARKASGQPAPEDWYKRARSVAYEAKLNADVNRWSDALSMAYPSADNWRATLTLYRDGVRLDDQQNLDLMRLMYLAHALKGERDYFEFADVAQRHAIFGDAVTACADATPANGVQPGSKALGEIRTMVAGKVAGDKASLAGEAAKARAAGTSVQASNTADAYLGYGDYAAAIDLYNVALGKPGADANTLHTRLGIALARSGQKQQAIAEFAKVTGARQPIAHYWTEWLSQQA